MRSVLLVLHKSHNNTSETNEPNLDIDQHHGHDDVDHINIIREKTFNEELKNLVTRITEHETAGDSIEEHIKNLSSLSDEEFLIALHRMFYRFKHLDDEEHSAVIFDPYGSYASEEIDYSVPQCLARAICSHGFKEYALLKYDFEKKGYVPAYFSLDNMIKENLIISLRDELYDRIINEEHGLRVTSDEIEIHDWLCKIFQAVDGIPYSLYCIKTAYLTRELHRGLIMDAVNGGMHALNDSLLLVRLTGEMMELNTRDVYTMLMTSLPVPLYIAGRNSIDSGMQNPLVSFENMQALLEYFFLIYSKNDQALCAMITTKKYYEKETTFGFKYMMSKLTLLLWPYSTIIHVNNRVFLIFTIRADEETIQKTLNEGAVYFKDTVSITFHGHAEMKTPLPLIEQLLY